MLHQYDLFSLLKSTQRPLRAKDASSSPLSITPSSPLLAKSHSSQVVLSVKSPQATGATCALADTSQYQVLSLSRSTFFCFPHTHNQAALRWQVCKKCVDLPFTPAMPRIGIIVLFKSQCNIQQWSHCLPQRRIPIYHSQFLS